MKIKQYAAFALMGLALGACQKPGGEDPDVVEPEGELVKTKLAISIPKSIRTYAPGEDDPIHMQRRMKLRLRASMYSYMKMAGVIV